MEDISDALTAALAKRAKQLLTWFTENGGWLHPSVTVEHTPNTGHRLRANQPLPANTNIVTCPLNLTLSYLNLDTGQSWVRHHDSPLQRLLGKVPNNVLGYLLLIEQLVLEERSPWHAYIDALEDPDHLFTAISYDTHYFHNTPLQDAREERGRILEAEHRHALRAMVAAHMHDTDIFKECDFETFLWAATIMSSRSFTSEAILPKSTSGLEPFSILYPVLDLANHDTRAKVSWSYPENRAFTLHIREPVSAGSEIFNNYGPKQNGELLLGYGFAIQDNPVEQVSLRLVTPAAITWDVRAENVPFWLDPTSVANTEGGLRTPTNLLGRYDTTRVPFFRGFPPNAVFAAYIQALCLRRMHLRDAPSVSGRLVLSTLLFLYNAMQDKCSRLPLLTVDTTQLTKEDLYCYYYRSGQAGICHYLRRELKAVLSKLRIPQQPPVRKDPECTLVFSSETATPCIVTLTDALLLMSVLDPEAHQNFLSGLERIEQERRLRDQYGQQTWVSLLAFWKMELGLLPQPQDTLISQWMRGLEHAYPERPDEDNDVESGHGAKYHADRFRFGFAAYFDGYPLSCEELAARIEEEVAWAAWVVRCEVFAMGNTAPPEYCMYMCPHPPAGKERWMFEDVSMLIKDDGPASDVRPF